MEKALKGKIIKEYIKESGRHKIPIFVVKLENGQIREIGRGELSVETFGKDYMSKTADEMKEFGKKTFYGLKVGDTVYISTQYNWD